MNCEHTAEGGLCLRCTMYEAGREVFIEKFRAKYPEYPVSALAALYDECLLRMSDNVLEEEEGVDSNG